jgi:hypothetical protein
LLFPSRGQDDVFVTSFWCAQSDLVFGHDPPRIIVAGRCTQCNCTVWQTSGADRDAAVFLFSVVNGERNTSGCFASSIL